MRSFKFLTYLCVWVGAIGVVAAQTPQPAPTGQNNSNPEAGKARIPMISATGRTPEEIEAAAKADGKTTAANETKSAPADAKVEDGDAKLPYRELIRIAKSDTKQSPDAQFYSLKITSKLKGVKPSDIKLYLEVPGEKMDLPVGADGVFQVPYTIDMYEKNPYLVANQPKGTLSIHVVISGPKIVRPKVEDGKVKYQELFRPVVQMAEEMAKVNPNFGKDGQQEFALEIETGNEPVIVKRTLGSRTLRPNAEGKIYMVLERLLFDENPEVLVPEKIAVNVKPVTAREAALIRAQ